MPLRKKPLLWRTAQLRAWQAGLPVPSFRRVSVGRSEKLEPSGRPRARGLEIGSHIGRTPRPALASPMCVDELVAVGNVAGGMDAGARGLHAHENPAAAVCLHARLLEGEIFGVGL